MSMLRLHWPASTLPPRLLTEDEFIREFQRLDTGPPTALPAGPVVVEGFDAQQRLAWTGHYRDSAGLRLLLRQLLEEREIRAKLRRQAGPLQACAPFVAEERSR